MRALGPQTDSTHQERWADALESGVMSLLATACRRQHGLEPIPNGPEFGEAAVGQPSGFTAALNSVAVTDEERGRFWHEARELATMFALVEWSYVEPLLRDPPSLAGHGWTDDPSGSVSARSSDLTEALDGQRVTLGGRVRHVDWVKAKGRTRRLIVLLDDGVGAFAVIVPRRLVRSTRDVWVRDEIVVVSGEVRGGPLIHADSASGLSEVRAMDPEVLGRLLAAERRQGPAG